MTSAIMKRRSIRKFTAEKVPADSAMRIVEAGAAAPSAMNKRPCASFCLIRRRWLPSRKG
ncbi:MAG: nitroreductase family protein [Cloacibacillus evryensis]